jgi:hypothetical protein
MRSRVNADASERPTHRHRDMPVRPAVVLGPVEEGSILVFAGIDVVGDGGGAQVEAIHQAVADVSGHDRFLVLFVESDARVALFGPDDLAHALRAIVTTAAPDSVTR